MQLGCPVTRRRALQDMETVQTFLASTLIPNSSEPNSLANNTGVFPRDIEIDKGTTTQKACVSPPQLRRLIEASCVTIQKPHFAESRMLQKACSLRYQTQADTPAVIGHGFLSGRANVATSLRISLLHRRADRSPLQPSKIGRCPPGAPSADSDRSFLAAPSF
jgi:hypothetical protein